jgi:hypothetical protein
VNFNLSQIFDGTSESSPSLGKLCGPNTPSSITSSGNSMTVKFVTDSSATGRGFSASYTSGKFCMLSLVILVGYVVAKWFTARLTCLTPRPVTNVSVQGVGSIPARGTRYVALYKRDFRRGTHIGGFLRALQFPSPSKGSYSPNVLGRRDTVTAVLSPGRVA